jgi:hypothetical protein
VEKDQTPGTSLPSYLTSSLGYLTPDDVEADWLEPAPAGTAPPADDQRALAAGLSDE